MIDKESMKDSIIEEFKIQKDVFHSFRDRIKNLLTDLINAEKLIIHQISCRTKTLNSLTKKIEDKNNKYSCIEDITDIVGVRIITYLESEVNAIFKLIESEFTIDPQNSVDKRKLNSDQFGYKSLHVIVSLNEKRGKLKEFEAYKKLKCEIQIRSILQHAWAEIEHDLGYKSEKGIPEPKKRTFNRLSALLETADVEFDRLKTELKDYDTDLPQLIKKEPQNVDLNNSSLKYMANNDPILKQAKLIIAKQVKKVSKNSTDVDILIFNLYRIEIGTIEDLSNLLNKNKELFFNYIKLSYDDCKDMNVSYYISIYAFIRFLILLRDGIEGYINYFDFNDWAHEYLETEKEQQIFKRLGIDLK